MTPGRSHMFRKVLLVINILVIIAYLLTCLVPFINTGRFWFISILGLGFPLLLISLVIFIIIWILYKSKWAWVSLIVLLLGFQQIKAAFAFHLPQKFTHTKGEKTIRILQYNVMGEEIIRQSIISKKKFNLKASLSFIKKTNADVLTFQEFFTGFDTANSLIKIIDSLGYPYHYISSKDRKNPKKYVGVAIFSKFPMLHSGTVSLNTGLQAVPLIYSDISVDGNVYRVFTTHLQSVGIDRDQYKNIGADTYGKSKEIMINKTIAEKLKIAYKSRFDQSIVVRKEIDKSPYPVIMAGDFNDVPNSNTYFKIKGNLQDGFLKKGSCIGRTFRYISPTLRIDFVFSDPIFKVTQFKIPPVSFSDHFPVIIDLQYP